MSGSLRGREYAGTPIWQRVSQQALRERSWTSCRWQEQLRRGEPLTDILILDGHAHLGEYPGFFINNGGDAASMVRVMDRIGMRLTVVAANAAMRSDQDYGNALALDAVRRFPRRFLGWVVANPYYTEEMAPMLERYLDEPGFVGIKLHPEIHDDYPMWGPRYQPVWDIASRRQVPVLFHTYFGGDRLEDIARLAELYPRVPMIVGHAGQDLTLEGMAEMANSIPNIYVDLSVPETFGMTEFFVEALDDLDKLLFGTDFPWGNNHFRVGAVVYARISDEAKRKILGENMAKLLKLPPELLHG